MIHLCGKGKTEPAYNNVEGYVQYEYISAELSDLFAAADLVVSRAGANAICELLALRKPMILIPLPAAVSRGDQILNAESFERQGFAFLIREEELTNETLLTGINQVVENRDSYIAAMRNSIQTEAPGTGRFLFPVSLIIRLMEEVMSKAECEGKGSEEKTPV